mmetsp:Transcript_26607/g.47342  ORF Transcript_26607/g.47342 Transcript_26607/m.47342 type:complete len:425 (-) Transcript_26607:506-1780(-)|eukprot:CAMPEP_0177773250 /NCGR_PEP_ID=MMETSP0491_2-20121128/12731_1 /TAXON_ID=63592 /ORGANISM="Tetraselmis chuii, Strain PLY429" /LENGTH=424 /DNA_ID=CAMNT_0019291265 /DNA_START=209 /DNA_END=1483 /DNA_ORIENTATION=+
MDSSATLAIVPMGGRDNKRARECLPAPNGVEPLDLHAKRRPGTNPVDQFSHQKEDKENQDAVGAPTILCDFRTRLSHRTERSLTASPVSRGVSPQRLHIGSTFAKVDELQDALARVTVDPPSHMISATGDKFSGTESVFPWLGGYAAHLLALDKHTEARYLPARDFLTRHAGIDATMRKKLIDWLHEVDYDMSNSRGVVSARIIFLAVNILDRFLSSTSITISPRNLQLVGIACYRMADKFERDELGISGAVQYCDFAFSASDVLKMESEVLKSTDFKLSVPTSVDFVEYFVTATNMEATNKKQKMTFKSMCSCILETALLSHRLAVEHKPSVVAAAAVLLAQRKCGMEDSWDATLELISGCCVEQLERPASQINELFSDWLSPERIASGSVPTAFTQWRYSSVRHACVANQLCQQAPNSAEER